MGYNCFFGRDLEKFLREDFYLCGSRVCTFGMLGKV